MDNLRPNPNKKLVNYIKHFLMQLKVFMLSSQVPTGQNSELAAPASCDTRLKSISAAQSLTYVPGIKEQNILKDLLTPQIQIAFVSGEQQISKRWCFHLLSAIVVVGFYAFCLHSTLPVIDQTRFCS